MAYDKNEKCAINNNSNSNTLDRPTLIFFEDHWDPATSCSLNLLFPRLVALGYSQYYEELPKNLNLDDAYNEIVEHISRFDALSKNMKREGFDINQPADVCSYAAKKNLPVDLVFSAVNDLIQRHPTHLQMERFYSYIKQAGIQFKAIDLKNVNLLSNVHLVTSIRDKLFTDEYINTKNPTIGRHGLGHAEGIQTLLLERLSSWSQDYLMNKYCFIYIYSRPVHEGAPMQGRVRNNEIKFPLGLIQINRNELSDEEIFNRVNSEIQKRTTVLCQLQSAEHEKVKKSRSEINLADEPLIHVMETLNSFFLNKRDRKESYQRMSDNNSTNPYQELNNWKKEALGKYESLGLTEVELRKHCVSPPFIQIHLDLMHYFVYEKGLTPAEVLKELNGLSQDVLCHMKELHDLGVKGDHLRTFKTRRMSFGESHVLMLEHLIRIENLPAEVAAYKINGVCESDAQQYCITHNLLPSIQLSFKS